MLCHGCVAIIVVRAPAPATGRDRVRSPLADDAAMAQQVDAREAGAGWQYRAWCEANLPSWLGYGRTV
jgi:hypothetical protein